MYHMMARIHGPDASTSKGKLYSIFPIDANHEESDTRFSRNWLCERGAEEHPSPGQNEICMPFYYDPSKQGNCCLDMHMLLNLVELESNIQ